MKVLNCIITFLISLIACFGGLAAPCQADAPQGWSRTSREEIRLTGEIRPDSFEQFTKVAEGGFRRVVLNSPGGKEFAAMRIAQDPRYRDADIIVSEKCISACANYLAVLGRSLAVDCNSVIGFHGTTLRRYPIFFSPFTSMMSKMNSKYKNKEVKNWYKNSEQEGRNLFKSREIDINLLFYRNSKFLKNFYELEFDPDTGGPTQTISQNGIWMPSEAQLRAFGLKNLTYCAPFDDQALRARIGRSAKNPATLRDYVWHVGP